MNPVTFNDSLEDDLRVFAVEKHEIINDNWKNSPLFIYEATVEHVGDAHRNGGSWESFPASPFPEFRLYAKIKVGEQSRILKGLVFVEAGDHGETKSAKILSTVLRGDSPTRSKKRCTYAIEIYRDDDIPDKMRARQIMNADSPDRGNYFLAGIAMLDGKVVIAGALSQTAREELSVYFQTSATYVKAFLHDCMSPNIHVAEVRPADEHRSVEWVRARTHYTLITHGHPANRQEVKEGERVQADQQGELTRMAHNRRAHYKTLRHERFRFARGKRIFVKATWVGPKEWRDEGGKQIYRILEPVDAQVAA
jgi:hypothetical protein